MSSVSGELDGQFDAVLEAENFVFEFDEESLKERFRELGIDPICPTPAKPGSGKKVLVLAARYAAGLPLWHDDDCYDHGPSGVASVLAEQSGRNPIVVAGDARNLL